MDVNSITRIAGLIGEAGRIQMLTALLDGNSHSASELAMAAAVSPQTASSHLSKLLSGGLIVSERSVRQRLFRFKNANVAVAIEALGRSLKTLGLPLYHKCTFPMAERTSPQEFVSQGNRKQGGRRNLEIVSVSQRGWAAYR